LIAGGLLIRSVASQRWDAGGRADPWWFVHFTQPGPDRTVDRRSSPVLAHLIDSIDRAQSTIDVAAFVFSIDPVADAVIAAATRGVRVRFVTDEEHGIIDDKKEGHGQFARMRAAGVEIRADDGRSRMDDRFWIFDRETVWTGSLRLMPNVIRWNHNNVIVLRSVEIAAIYEREFEEMWGGAFGHESPPTREDQTASIEGTRVEVLFAPEDAITLRVVEMIANARRSLRLLTQAITDDTVGDAIIERAKSGVDVRAIMESRVTRWRQSEFRHLLCAGVAVRPDGNPRGFDHMALVIDEETVVTGWFDLMNDVDGFRDQNAVILQNAEIAAAYLEEFDRLWGEAPVPEVEKIPCPKVMRRRNADAAVRREAG
jgi:phosphatidylserine/phosphatidylglycerophosphate/cardiolipin synthase-like enzyme